MLIIAAIASLMVLVASTSIILYNNPSNFKANAAPALKETQRNVCPNPGFADCSLVRSDQCETNILTNSQHCGACDNACAQGASCTNGQCTCPNSNDLICNGACTAQSTSNCGGCGNVCPTGSSCTNGQCQCPPGQSACSGACVTFDTNTNCGACGNTCGQGSNPTGSTCQSGACKCPGGQFLNSAGTACVQQCGTNEVVNANRQCTTCPSGTTAQNGQCVDPPPTKVCTSQGCVGNNVNCPVDPSDPTGPTVCKPITQCDFCKIP
jgi:hypothetical protein